jgi:DNA-nicking Smr family endonuclease
MSSSDNVFDNRPFANLGRLMKRKMPGRLPSQTFLKPSDPLPTYSPDDPRTERQLFLDAVRDVTPLQNRNRITPSDHSRNVKPSSIVSDDAGACGKLKRLVASGEGFVISQTPEYMEGAGYDVPNFVMEQLHRGRFSIQDHIDLHGMDASGATEALEGFLKRVTGEGLRSVLIIHGRGLSSPGKPVLKGRLRSLLNSNRWRKWVIAFSSARSCDGGAGATYVLLRKQPLKKRKQKSSVFY